MLQISPSQILSSSVLTNCKGEVSIEKAEEEECFIFWLIKEKKTGRSRLSKIRVLM